MRGKYYKCYQTPPLCYVTDVTEWPEFDVTQAKDHFRSALKLRN